MLKKTITYMNFNDEEETEDFYFHLSQAELAEMELSHKGGLKAALERIIEKEDGKAIVEEFKNIILSSYGEKSLDGKRFMKTQELRDKFVSTEAYSVLFMELATDTDAAIEFINGVVPAALAAEVAKIPSAHKDEKGEKITVLEPVVAEGPDLPDEPRNDVEPRTVTQAELDHMSMEQIAALRKEVAEGTVVIETA